MKKLIALMLALVMCVGMMSVVASAAGSPSLAVSSAKGEAGKSVEVSVTLSNNPGIAMLEFDIEYDSSRLTLEGMSATNVLPDAAAKTRYIWVTNVEGDSKAEGKILTLNFTVKADAAPGDAVVKVKNVNCGNWAEEELSVGTSAGKVTLACAHKWGEWAENKAPSCTEKGEMTRECELCGETETKAVDALGHKWGEWTTTKDATCKAKGEKTRECSACGETETKTTDKVAHKYKNGKCIWCNKSNNKDNVADTGDITSVVTMGVIAMISVVAAAAYVTKRRITK